MKGNRLLLFIIIGLIYAAFPGEISNQLLVRRTPHGFVVTMLNYVWFLALGYSLRGVFERRCKTRYAARLRYYLFYGFVGVCIEWFLILPGFAFQLHPVQLMLFSFWAGMLLTPSLFIEEPATDALRTIQYGLARYILIWSAVSLLPFVAASLLMPSIVEKTRGFSMLVFGIGVLGTNLYYFRYLKLLKAQA
jgi:hypothetical protein